MPSTDLDLITLFMQRCEALRDKRNYWRNYALALEYEIKHRRSPKLSISPVQTVASIAPSHNGTMALVPRRLVTDLKHFHRSIGRIAKSIDSTPEKTTRTHTASAPSNPVKATVNAVTATDPVNRTCKKCEAVLPSRNSLFHHIYANECSPPMKKSTAKPTMPSINHPSRLPSPHNQQVALPYTQQPPRSPSARSSRLASPVRRPLRQPTIPTSNEGFKPSVKPVNSAPASQPATQSVPKVTVQPSQPATQLSHSCQHCGEAFQSRNQLFSHLHTEGHKRPASAKRSKMSASWIFKNTSLGGHGSILEGGGQLESTGALSVDVGEQPATVSQVADPPDGPVHASNAVK